MLPVHRLIGHREWGNTPPPLGNGWAGRKTDPSYDMNWRRRRVAAFEPRGDDMPTPDEIADEIWTRPVKGVDGKDYPIGAAIQTLAHNAHFARIDAAVARRLAEEAAKAGQPLSQEDVDRIAEATKAELAKDYTLQGTASVVPKPSA